MNAYLAVLITAIFSTNIITTYGIGAVGLQSEKRSFPYMIVSAVSLILTILSTGVLYNLIETYVLIKLEVEYLKLFVVMCLAVVFGFVVKAILKAISKEIFFLYERCYTFPIHIAINVGVLLVADFTKTLGMNVYSLLMMCVGYLFVQIIFYAIYERIDNKHVLKPARNVPLMLYILGFISMMFCVVMKFF